MDDTGAPDAPEASDAARQPVLVEGWQVELRGPADLSADQCAALAAVVEDRLARAAMSIQAQLRGPDALPVTISVQRG
jgi:hypothetical protein